MATDPTTGHIFVADSGNGRIQEFSAWGSFVKAWGWGVIASGPGNQPQDEVQEVSVDATGGSFKLDYGSEVEHFIWTSPIAYNASAAAVQAAIEETSLFDPGDVAVTGAAGGPWTIEVLGDLVDTDIAQPLVVESSLSGGAATATVTTPQDGAAFEICDPALGDECRAGQPGRKGGQLTSAAAVGVDSTGDVYVADWRNRRVSKFDSEGNFVLTFGGGVNVTTGSDVCTAASGDVCGKGSEGTGSGEFGAWPGPTLATGYLAVGTDDTVYVGDVDRIQRFDTDGNYLGSLPLPHPGKVGSLAVDPGSGDLYLAYPNFDSNLGPAGAPPAIPNVYRLDSDAGTVLDTLEAEGPGAIAVDADGNVYVFQREFDRAGFNTPTEVRLFGPTGNDLGVLLSKPSGNQTQLATSSACGLEDANLLLSKGSFENPYISLYGETPDPAVCPPPELAPEISAQYATAVEPEGAVLQAKINPHFWVDTRYYVEYGTGKCSEGLCTETVPTHPGALLSKKGFDADLTTAPVFLEGLEPATIYHYRFVAKSGGGGPVKGVGGTDETDGAEWTFRTPPAGTETSTCPNEALRTGLSARLPDCRAYELVSPLDKNGGDVGTGGKSLPQASIDGDRATFSSLIPFGNAGGAPLISQYLSVRDPGSGWSSESIASPRESSSFYGVGGTSNEFLFKAFSDDLCSAWLIQDNPLELTPDSPRDVPNLYRRQNCTGGHYEAITRSHPLGFSFVLEDNRYFPQVQGFSADGSKTAFRADAALATEPGGPRAPLTCSVNRQGADPISYQWLRNGTEIEGATERNYTPTPEDEGTAVQCRASVSSGEGTTTFMTEPAIIDPIGPVALPDFPRHKPASAFTGASLAPTLTGNPAVGQALTCQPGSWKGSPTFTYRWLRNGEEIASATASEYLLSFADRDTAIQCEALGTNAGGTVAATSDELLIQAAPPVSTTQPSVSGTPTAGQQLTCQPGIWSGGASFSYLWLRNGTNIAGATASTYTLVAADEGKAVQCRVRAANLDGATLAASERVIVFPAPGTTPPDDTATPEIEGTPAVGQTLSCEQGTWTGSPTFAFKWLRNGVVIAGATEASYELEAADSAKAIQCQVTATNAGGSATAYSPPRYLAPQLPHINVAWLRGHFQTYVTVPGGGLRLVSVLPDGSAALGSSSVGTATLGEFEGDFRNDSVHRAVSVDGERVFWTAREPEKFNALNEGGIGDLYLRVNATAPQSVIEAGQCTEPEKACTILISDASTIEPEKEGEEVAAQVRFVSASPAGDRVLYTVGEMGNAQAHLFSAEIAEEGGSLVVKPTQIAGEVKGVMGASSDARHIYFASREDLTGSQSNSEGEAAEAGALNLYLYEQGEGLTFVAGLSGLDAFFMEGPSASSGPLATMPKLRSARVSPDGLHAAFTSVASLTAYDNTDINSGQPDAEVYRFDAAANGGAGELICVSCNPGGTRPAGRLWVAPPNPTEPGIWAASLIPGWPSQTHPSHALSDDGDRVFFNSYDSLLPADSNGKLDVYEWEAPGKGTCTEGSPRYSPDNGGCVSLISSGQSATDSEFFDATPTGSDVFFATGASLLPEDYGLIDVYDARVNGGFPSPTPPGSGCEGEACQGTPEAPNDPTPASSAFQGSGNVVEESTRRKPCPKGKVRRKGRCVKKHKPARKHGKKKQNNQERRNAR